MYKLKTLNSLKSHIERKFMYKNMLFSFSESTNYSLSEMFLKESDRDVYLMKWRAYTQDGGNNTVIYLYFKVLGTKLMPYKVVHTDN